MPGPKPTPTAKLANRGSWRAKTRGGEPAPPEGNAIPPAWLLSNAEQYWDKILPMLEGMGIMSPAYSPMLGLLVNSMARYIEYEERVTTSGPVTLNTNGNEATSPWWTARNKALDQVLKISREFGLSPAAMTTIRMPDSPPKTKEDGNEGVLRLA